MNKLVIIILLLFTFSNTYSQKLLTSWSQQNIENYTKEMYDDAQKLTSAELLNKNLKDNSWSAVFLTLNASINNFKDDKEYHISLANQLNNNTETKLEGTSRLIIWDRITSKDILFEGKGLVMDNDLFTVAGRANQVLQSLTGKNFGYVSKDSTLKELEELKKKWLFYLSNTTVEEYKGIEYKNAKIPEVSSLSAVNAMIISLQPNSKKEAITKKCLKNIYKLDELPTDKSSPAMYCNPDTYTYAYLAMVFGDQKLDETKNAKWWLDFWNLNQNNLIWDAEKGMYKLK